MEGLTELERLTLVDMERKLLADVDGSYRKSLLEKLQAYQNEIRAKLSSGLSPEDFTVYNQLKQALDEAYAVVINFK